MQITYDDITFLLRVSWPLLPQQKPLERVRQLLFVPQRRTDRKRLSRIRLHIDADTQRWGKVPDTCHTSKCCGPSQMRLSQRLHEALEVIRNQLSAYVLSELASCQRRRSVPADGHVAGV